MVKLITFSFGNNMNPGAGDQYFPYEMGQQFPQYPPGWICPMPIPYIFNDRGTPSPSPSTTSCDSLQESFQFSKDGSMPGSSQTSLRRTSSSAENILRSLVSRFVDRKKRVKAVSQEIARRSQHGVMFCSHILFSSATVAFRTIFLSLADFKSDLS